MECEDNSGVEIQHILTCVKTTFSFSQNAFLLHFADNQESDPSLLGNPPLSSPVYMLPFLKKCIFSKGIQLCIFMFCLPDK